MLRCIVEGYVIVSADGMLAESGSTHMPDVLRFAADQAFLKNALARVDLVVRGRNSTDDFPGRDKRRQIIVTRRIATISKDVTANVTLWNPERTGFDAVCEAAGLTEGRVAVLGGPEVYALFLDRFDAFYLSQASQLRLPGGKGCFPGVPARTPQQILAAHGLSAAQTQTLDAARGVVVTTWERQTS